MALAGFSDDKNSLWKHFCSSPKAKLTDAYLKAMFAFLTAENGNYDGVLVSNGFFRECTKRFNIIVTTVVLIIFVKLI